MSEDQKERYKRASDALFQIMMVVTPLLLLVVIYFVKPIFDAVPELVRHQEVAAIQQQSLVNSISEVSAKQEHLEAQVVNVSTKVEVVGAEVNRLQRKIDP